MWYGHTPAHNYVICEECGRAAKDQDEGAAEMAQGQPNSPQYQPQPAPQPSPRKSQKRHIAQVYAL